MVLTAGPFAAVCRTAEGACGGRGAAAAGACVAASPSCGCKGGVLPAAAAPIGGGAEGFSIGDDEDDDQGVGPPRRAIEDALAHGADAEPELVEWRDGALVQLGRLAEQISQPDGVGAEFGAGRGRGRAGLGRHVGGRAGCKRPRGRPMGPLRAAAVEEPAHVADAADAASGRGACGAVGKQDISEKSIGDAGEAAAQVRTRGALAAATARPPGQPAAAVALASEAGGDSGARGAVGEKGMSIGDAGEAAAPVRTRGALAAATARPPGQPARAVAFASEAASGSGARGAVGEMDVSEENIGDAGKAAALVRERGAPSAPAARPPAEIADFLATLRAHGHGDGVCRHVAAVLRRRGHW